MCWSTYNNGSGLELFQRILVFQNLADIAQQVKMVVADTGNAEHEVGFFIAEVHEMCIRDRLENGIPIPEGNFIGSNEKAIWEAIVPNDPVRRQEMLMAYREYRKRCV